MIPANVFGPIKRLQEVDIADPHPILFLHKGFEIGNVLFLIRMRPGIIKPVVAADKEQTGQVLGARGVQLIRFGVKINCPVLV